MVLPYLFSTRDSSFSPLRVGLSGSAPTSSSNLLYASAPNPIPQCPKHVISTGAGGSGVNFDKPNHHYEDWFVSLTNKCNNVKCQLDCYRHQTVIIAILVGLQQS